MSQPATVAAAVARRAFEYRHVVAFEETNLVGNVYYVNHLRWQGRCRELFLARHCPELVAELSRGLALVTTRCSCEYLAELAAFDQVSVRMTLQELAQNRVSMGFEYWCVSRSPHRLVARGEQQIAVMRRQGETFVAEPVPPCLAEALVDYAGDAGG